MKVWATIAAALERHGRCAMVTVAEVVGSAPREAGARMIVTADGGFRGTIGGGALEWRALAEAQSLLAHAAPQARLRRQALGPELGQCCGGAVRLLIEVFDRSMAEEVRGLAEREAAGAFATSGRIAGGAVRRTIMEGAEPRGEALGQGSNRWNQVTLPRMQGRGTAPGAAEGAPAGRGAAVPPLAAHAATPPPLHGGGRHPSTGSDHPPVPVRIAANGEIVEVFADRTRSVFLFGAGHVGRALVLALAPLPFDVTWIDQRRDAFPSAMPANVRAIHSPEPAAELGAAPDGAFILVMTHSHALDLDIVHAALAAQRFAYVGLIGSATKRARFLSRLKAIGLSETARTKLVCPIGIPGIRSKAPAAIAAAVAADLLIRNDAVERREEAVAVLAERA